MDGRRELVERVVLMVSGVVAARRRRYLMLNAPRSALEEIRASAAGDGRPVGDRPCRAGPDRGARGGRCRRHLEPAGAAQGCRRLVDPGAAGGAAGRVRGASLEDVLPRVAEIVADVRERGDAALLDWTERLDGERPELRVPADQLRARTPAAGRARRPAGARRRGRRLLRATAAARRRARGGRRRALGAALGPAGLGRRLRPRRAGEPIRPRS